MKRILLALAFAAGCVAAASAMTLREGFDEIAKIAPPEGVTALTDIQPKTGWIESLPIEGCVVTGALHEVGNGQTVYYGSKVEEIAKTLPQEDRILYGANFQNIFYMYARAADGDRYEVLILVDQAYQGKTLAVYGFVEKPMIQALRQGKVRFTYDHQIVISVPLMEFR